LFLDQRTPSGVNVQDIGQESDDEHQTINKSCPSADIDHFFERPEKAKGASKEGGRAKCLSCKYVLSIFCPFLVCSEFSEHFLTETAMGVQRKM
jgi:hypothetical protein